MAKRIKRQCSFCGKRENEVRKLIAGPGVFICDQCVALANEIVHNEGPPPAPQAPAGPLNSRRLRLSSWVRNLFQVRSYTT
jgi:hypothetical protein